MIYISVCKNTILSNLKQKKNDPPIRVSKGLHGRPKRYHEYTAHGTTKVVYSPNKPAPWGARVWLEVDDGKN